MGSSVLYCLGRITHHSVVSAFWHNILSDFSKSVLYPICYAGLLGSYCFWDSILSHSCGWVYQPSPSARRHLLISAQTDICLHTGSLPYLLFAQCIYHILLSTRFGTWYNGTVPHICMWYRAGNDTTSQCIQLLPERFPFESHKSTHRH